MCFSTEVSFGAAAILGAAGTIALKRVNNRNQIMFAAIPLVFGIQQAIEGVQWLSLTHTSMAKFHIPAMYAFLFFAQILWTTWMPLAFRLIETNATRKKLLNIALAAGIADSLLLAYRLLNYPVTASIDCMHIDYNFQSTPFITITSSVLYVIAIIVPPFVSGLKEMKILGTLLTSSLILSKLVYESYLISVWCFFAAVISIMIAHMMKQFSHEQVNAHHNPSLDRVSHQ